MNYLNKIIEYLLYIFVFLLPIQTRWIIKAGETEYLTYSLYATDILLLAVLVLFFILKFSIFNFQFSNNFSIFNFQTKFKIQNLKFKIQSWWFILGLISTSAVSVFFAFDKLLALYKLGWLIMSIGLFWLIIRANYSKLKLIYALLAGIFLQAVLGIWQFLTQSSFANKWLGLALHSGSDLGASVIETIGANGVGERWLRVYGGLDHPNMLGGILVIGILMIILIIVKVKTQNSKILLSTFYFLLSTFLIALFFTFSRSAWLGLAVGLVAMIALAKKTEKTEAASIFVGTASVFFILAILFLVLFSQCQNLVMTRISGQGRLEIKSTTERLASYQDAWSLIKNNWIAGVGIGNYTLHNAKHNFIFQPVHNVYLLVWAEIGVVGFLFFLGLLLCVTRYALRNKNLILNISLIVAITMMFAVDHWWWSLHFGVLFFWLVIGLLAVDKSA